jgi:hypothetical protein
MGWLTVLELIGGVIATLAVLTALIAMGEKPK